MDVMPLWLTMTVLQCNAMYLWYGLFALLVHSIINSPLSNLQVIPNMGPKTPEFG